MALACDVHFYILKKNENTAHNSSSKIALILFFRNKNEFTHKKFNFMSFTCSKHMCRTSGN